MKKMIIGCIALLALAAGCGGGSDETAMDTSAASWQSESAVTVESDTELASLATAPAGYVGQVVRLEGKVTGVCKGSGCWVEIADEDGHSFIAKSVDHTIAFPKDCEGKIAVVQGEIVSQPAPEHAEDHDHGEGDHVCPAPTYMLSLAAAELR